MSMLAAPRRRQKWTLNPRGKQWSEDSNKFGQKMLEKMGWSNGKGLGAQGQGMVEHIRVKVKNDQVGIGYSKDRDDLWNQHQDGFDSFLQNLQKEQSVNNKATEDKDTEDKLLSGKSLEEKSKHSQKRVHYKKFIRGKDVNKYTPKDLANIFGKKDLNEKYVKNEEKDEHEENNSEICDPIGAKDTTAGIITIKGGNINDYFKNKIIDNTNKNYSNQDKNNCESETEKYTGFGYSVKSKSKFYINNDASSPVNEDTESESENYKGFGSKSQKHNLNYVFDNPCLDLNILDNNSPISKKIKTKIKDLNLHNVLTPKKRKTDINEDEFVENSNKPKSKKRKSELGYTNIALDLESLDKNETLNENDNFNYKTENFLKNENEESDTHLQYLNKKIPTKSIKIKSDTLLNEYDALDLELVKYLTPKNTKQNENNVLSNGYDNLGLDLKYSEKSILKTTKQNVNDHLSNEYDNSRLDLEHSEKLKTRKSKKNKSKSLSDENAGGDFDIDFSGKLTKIETEIAIQNNSKLLSKGYDNLGLNLEDSNISPKKNKKNNNDFVLSGHENLQFNLQLPDILLSNKNKKVIELEDLSSVHENSKFDPDAIDIMSLKKKKKEKNSESLTNVDENSISQRLDKTIPTKPKRCKKDKSLSTGYENHGLNLEAIKVTPKADQKYKNFEIMSNAFDNPTLDLTDSVNETQAITNFEVSRPICGVENNALDLSDENSKKKRVTFNDQIEYSFDTIKKKKKKKKLDKYEVVNEKIKKIKKEIEPVAFVNEGLDIEVINEEEIDNELNERKSKKCKKRRERRISLLETIEETPEEEIIDDSPKIEEKTEKKSKNHTLVVKEILHESVIENVKELENKNSFKKKDKKKNEATTENIITIDELEEINSIDRNIDITNTSKEPIKISKKKKKKKNTEVEFIEVVEIDNGIGDLDKENVCIEKEKKKKKKEKNISLNEDKVSLEEFLNEDVQTISDSEKINETYAEDEVETETKNRKQIYTKDQYKAYQKAKISRQRIKEIFKRNPVLMFPGSNINEISGYGNDDTVID